MQRNFKRQRIERPAIRTSNCRPAWDSDDQKYPLTVQADISDPNFTLNSSVIRDRRIPQFQRAVHADGQHLQNENLNPASSPTEGLRTNLWERHGDGCP